MKKKIFSLFIIIFIFSNCKGYIDTAYWFGAIQFPCDFNLIPSIRMYRSGETLEGLRVYYDHEKKRIEYSFSENQYQKTFYVVIVKKIYGKTENGSAQYLRIDTSQPYAFYKLEHKEGQWRHKQLAIPYDTGRIPDSTLIICIDPHWMEQPSGGTDYELPTFHVKNSLLESEEDFHTQCCEILFTCGDSDRLHRKPDLLVKCEKNIIITLEQS